MEAVLEAEQLTTEETEMEIQQQLDRAIRLSSNKEMKERLTYIADLVNERFNNSDRK